MTELNYDISELTPVNYLDWILQTDYIEGCKTGDVILNDRDKIDDRNYYIYEIEEKCLADIKIINKVDAKVLNIKHKGETLVIQGGINADKETFIKVEGKNVAINNLTLDNIGLFVTESFNFLLSGKSAVKDFNLKAEGVVKLYGDIKSEVFYIKKYPILEIDDNRHILSAADRRISLEVKSIECGSDTLISSSNNEILLKIQDYAKIYCNILGAVFKYNFIGEDIKENEIKSLTIAQSGSIIAKKSAVIEADSTDIEINGVIYSGGDLKISGNALGVHESSSLTIEKTIKLLGINKDQLEKLLGNLHLNILCKSIKVNAQKIFLGKNSAIIDEGMDSIFFIGKTFESFGTIINNYKGSGAINFECKNSEISFITHKESNIYSLKKIEVNPKLMYSDCKVKGKLDGNIVANEALILAFDSLIIGEENNDSRLHTINELSSIKLYTGFGRKSEIYDILDIEMFNDGSRCLLLNYGKIISNKIKVQNNCFFANYNLIYSNELKLNIWRYDLYQRGKLWTTNHASFILSDNKNAFFQSGSITYVGSFTFGTIDEEFNDILQDIDVSIPNVFCEPGCIFVRTDINKKVSKIHAITHTVGDKRTWKNEHIAEHFDKNAKSLVTIEDNLISPAGDLLNKIKGGLWQDMGETEYTVGMIYRKQGEVLLLGVNFKFPASIVDSSSSGYDLGFYNNQLQVSGLIDLKSKFYINILSGSVGSLQVGVDSIEQRLLIDHERLQAERELKYIRQAEYSNSLSVGLNSELVKYEEGDKKYDFYIDTVELRDSQILYGKLKEKCDLKDCPIYLKNKDLILKPINYLNILEESTTNFIGTLFDISGFLEILGLEEKGEYYVIGDGYYIYRQANDAAYRILGLEVKGGSGILTDMLAVNSIKEKEELNLIPGIELNEEEVAKLKSTIIWPIWQDKCFKGDKCLNFKIYFDSKIALPLSNGNNFAINSKENIKVLGDILISSQGHLIAKDYLILDGEGRFQNKGVIISEKYLEINNEEATNLGIFYVKGGLKIGSNRHIVNIGTIEVYENGFAYLESGGSIKELLLLKDDGKVKYKAVYIVDGNLYYESGIDIKQQGSERYVNGNVVANAKGDIKRESIHATKVKNEVIKKRYYLLEHEINEYRVSDMVTGDVVYKAEGKYINLGGTIMSTKGDVYYNGEEGTEDKTFTSYATNKEEITKIRSAWGIKLGSTSIKREWSISKTSRSEIITESGKFYISSEKGACYLEGVNYKGKTNPVVQCDNLAIENHKIQNFIREVVVKRGFISPSIPASQLLKGNVDNMPIVGSLKGVLNMQGPFDLAAPMKLFTETVRLKKDMEAANKMLGGKASAGSQFIVAMLSKYVSAGITMGYSRTEIYQSQEQIIESEIQTEQYLKINITGYGKAKIQGKVGGKTGTELHAKGDVDLEGSKINAYQKQESEHETFGISVGLDGINVNVGAGDAEVEVTKTRYTETKLGIGGIVKLNLGGDLKIESATVNGEEVDLNAAKAMINDVLSSDSLTAESSGINMGLHIGSGGINPTGGIDFSQTEENKEFREFISGIKGNKVSIKVGELTYSTDQINGEELKIEAGKINVKEKLEGSESKKGLSFSASASVGLDGKIRSDVTARYQDNDFVISGYYSPDLVEGWKKLTEQAKIKEISEKEAEAEQLRQRQEALTKAGAELRRLAKEAEEKARQDAEIEKERAKSNEGLSIAIEQATEKDRQTINDRLDEAEKEFRQASEKLQRMSNQQDTCSAGSGTCRAQGDTSSFSNEQKTSSALDVIDKELKNLNLPLENENKVRRTLLEDPFIRALKEGNVQQLGEEANTGSKNPYSNVKPSNVEDIKGKIITALGNKLGNRVLDRIMPVMGMYNLVVEHNKVAGDFVKQQKAKELIDSLEGIPQADKLPENPGTSIDNRQTPPNIEINTGANKQEPLPGFAPAKPTDNLEGSTIHDQNFDDYTFSSKISESDQKTIQDALNSGDNSKVSDALGKTIDLDIPKEALDKIPSDLKIKEISNRGAGIKYRDKENGQESIRLMKGNPTATKDSQKNDYVKITNGGKVIGRNGNVIKDGPNEKQGPGYHPDAHIPKNEWVKWKQWNKP